MAASPSYGERPTMQGAFRRSFTVPARQLSFHEKAGLDKSDANADTLYSHPTARIISFSPPTQSIKSTNKTEIPADTDYPIDTVETLPWRSRSEALIATGLMVIEKVRGSTNFLKCQDIMHAILRNSQCWCVDGESKFVLRVRKFQYYRIELPSTTQEDKAKVEELKKVFPTVLRFERTPCPFIRAFTVDLPEDAITPRRKGQWKRRDSSQSNTPDAEIPPLRIKKLERSWSSQTPPSSYPRNSSAHNLDGDRGRPGGPPGMHRRRSLFEDQRNSSPAGFARNEDGIDSDQQGSGHDSELEHTDRSETSSPWKYLDNPARKERVLAELSVSEAEVDLQEPTKLSDVSTGAAELAAMQTHPEEPGVFSDSVARAASYKNQDHDEPQSSKSNESMLPDTGPLTALSEIHDNVTIVTHSPKSQPLLDLYPEGDTTHTLKAAGVEEDFRVQDTSSPVVVNDDVENDELYDTLLKEVSILPDSSRNSSPNPRNGASPLNMADQPDTTNTTSENTSTEQDVSHKVRTDSQIYSLSNLIESGTDVPISSESRLERTSPALTPATTNSLDLDTESSSYPVPELGQADDVGAMAASDFEVNSEQSVETTRNSEGSEHDIRPILTTNDVQKLELSTRKIDITADGAEVGIEGSDGLSPVSSVDSFHTLASTMHRESFDDPPDSDTLPISRWQAPCSSRVSNHKRDISEITVTASSASEPASPEHTRSTGQEYSPALTPSHLQSSTFDQDSVRHRFKARKRSFSPLPPASTIFTGNQIRHDSGRGHMTKKILQKVVVKPIEVAILVIHILARIASGATVNDLLSGELFRRPDQQKVLSGNTEQPKDSKSGSDTEDDYGVPLRGRRRSSEMRMATVFDDETVDVFAEID